MAVHLCAANRYVHVILLLNLAFNGGMFVRERSNKLTQTHLKCVLTVSILQQTH